MDFEQSWGALEQHSIENASWGGVKNIDSPCTQLPFDVHSVDHSSYMPVAACSADTASLRRFRFQKNGKFSLDTCRFLSTILPNRGPPAETQTILGDPWGNHDHTRKNAMIRARRLHHPRTDCYRDLLFPAASCRSYFRGWHDYKGDHGLSSAIGKFANFNFVWW